MVVNETPSSNSSPLNPIQSRIPFLLKSELILRAGPINKRKGFFSKRRLLILTDFPRLIYVDQEKMSQKGEIYWNPRMVVELKNKKNFFIHTVCLITLMIHSNVCAKYFSALL